MCDVWVFLSGLWRGTSSKRSIRLVISPPSLLPSASSIQGTLDTARKFAAGENKSSHRGHMNMKKLDDETEEFQREFYVYMNTRTTQILLRVLLVNEQASTCVREADKRERKEREGVG